MRVELNGVLVVSTGSWDIGGKQYPYVNLSTGEGDPGRYSIPQEVDPQLPVFSKVNAVVTFEYRDGKWKARVVDWAPASSQAAFGDAPAGVPVEAA